MLSDSMEGGVYRILYSVRAAGIFQESRQGTALGGSVM
jgi:hypothetical protein